MDKVRISNEPNAPQGLWNLIDSRLGSFNVAKTGFDEFYPVSIFLRGTNDEVVGGLIGNIWARWLFVRDLWISEPERGNGWGSKLMAEAERYAIEKGAEAAYLDTHSFQARPFYEKLGYKVFGVLEDHPPGHSHYWLTKKLTAKS